MIPTKFQKTLAKEGLHILRRNGLVYLAVAARAGKTLSAILIAKETPYDKVIVLTTKKAIPGWQETLESYKPKQHYTVSTYHSAGKLTPCKALIILDEAHTLSAFPKLNSLHKATKKLTMFKNGIDMYNLVIYLSATPYPQGPHQLQPQLALSGHSKDVVNSYQWYKKWAKRDLAGKTKKIRLAIGEVETYKDVEPAYLETVKHLFISKTRADAGITIEPIDKLHYVTLSPATIKNIESLRQGRFDDISFDTPMKLAANEVCLEGGALKVVTSTVDKSFKVIKTVKYNQYSTEKADYILDLFTDTAKLVIMYHYKSDLSVLKTKFKHALLLQGDAYAEGTDLHKYEHLVVYSMSWRTSKYHQRRCRQANLKRKTAITIHYLVCQGYVSENVYTTVALNDKNYTAKLYERETKCQ